MTTSSDPRIASLTLINAYDFKEVIRKFNELYGLPINESPSVIYDNPDHLIARLKQFKAILLDEVSEVDDIIDFMNGKLTDKVKKLGANAGSKALVLTMIADWLGDLQVYCASEMLRFGLDNNIVLSIIMHSNMSKLGADGNPIISDGKVQKGPNYWAPEELIKRYIEAEMRIASRANTIKS